MSALFRPSLHTLTLGMVACLQVAQTIILLVSVSKEPVSSPPPPALAMSAPAPRAPVEAPTEFGSTLRQTGEGSYAIQRQDLENTLARMSEVAMQARIVPSFRGGVPRGFKLFAMKPDSIYARLGLQNGDIIQRINGFPLDRPEQAMEAYNHLRTASRIEFDIEREGQTMNKTCTVEN